MFEGRDHRSKVKVTKAKINAFHGFCLVYLTNDLEIKGLEGQGLRSRVKVKGHTDPGQRSLAKAK